MRLAETIIFRCCLRKTFCLVILFSLFFPTLSRAETHTVFLKVHNPNPTLSTTTVVNSDGAPWTQVYVEIPAKLYMEKGWLDSDLENLRFIDVDSGDIELSYWVPPKSDNNLKINHLGVWLLVKDLAAGETEILKIEMVDGGSFYANPRASSDQTKNRTSYAAAATVFPFYGYNSSDWKWESTNSAYPYTAGTEFINKKLYSEDDLWGDAKSDADAMTGNEFTITIHNMKFNAVANSASAIYFLSQAAYNQPDHLDAASGYRLFLDDYTSLSDDLHYTQYQFTIKLQEYSSGTWVTVAETLWAPYNNSRFVFDIKVSSDRIFLVVNGRQHDFTAVGSTSVSDGQYVRTDSLTEGHVGYDLMTWRVYSNSGINYFTVRRFLSEEVDYEVYGNADLIVSDTVAGITLGQDVNEIVPDLQQFRRVVGGNTLEDYLFATYSIARSEQIIDTFKIRLKNRSTSNADTFTWDIQNSNPSKWIVYFCDDSGNNCTRTAPTTTPLGSEASVTLTIKFVPTLSALVNGSTAQLTLLVEGQADGSFDSARFTAATFGNLGCFWKYKAKQVVTWAGGNGYDDLLDYQVPITITGESDLEYARDDGTDIVITDDHSNILDFWVESYDTTTNTLKAWVKVPTLTGSNGNVDLYVWWGNGNYMTSRSNRQATFDLYEDWESDYADYDRVGCDDGTTSTSSDLANFSCEDEAEDPHGWENVPTTDDFYNWWEVDTIGGSKMMQADVSSSHKSSDKGPFMHRGGLGWDHYEVSYTFYTGTYSQYSGSTRPWGNPQYNPVYFNDAGNMWGMEYFADKFIFRPYAAGIDYTWQYQTYARGLLGSSFPQNNRWYSAKVRVFKNKVSGESHLKLFMSDPQVNTSFLPDIDSDADYTLIADFEAPPVFSLDYGGIGFGGWDSGFAFDDIRVRKYTEDSSGNEPVVTNSTITENAVRPDLRLSSPQITAPIFAGRPAYIEIQATPFAWRGDFFAYYADCYVLGDCHNSECSVCGGTEECSGVLASDCEDASKLGTVSVFGNVDDSTPKGAGYYLLKRDPGENNPTSPLQNNRKIYTTNGIETTFLDFGMNNCVALQSSLGTIGNCVDETSLSPVQPVAYDETEKLIRFVRGYYIDDTVFARSDSRNFDSDIDYGNANGIPEPDEQWKISDALHSNPLMIGIPNMIYGYPDYWRNYVNSHDDRALVAYFMTNEGMLHAIRLASVDADGYYQPDPEASELWAFIPHGVLSKLKDTRDSEHEYVADGLLRAIDVKIDHDKDLSTGDTTGDEIGAEWRTILFGIGGRENTYVFGMDVTDPEAPILLWEMDADSAGRIGTTLSAPGLGRIDTDNDGVPDKWVAIVGSGYSLDYLDNYETSTAWLTVIDLANGDILKQLKVSNKVGNALTDMTVLRNPKTGEIEKLFFGDYYGCLWRVGGSRIGRTDFEAPLSTGDMLSEIDDLLYKPLDYATTLLPDAPDYPIVARPRVAKGKEEHEFWVYFGTGDYNEYDANYPFQSFFGLRDRDGSSGPYVLTDLFDVTDTTGAANSHKESWFLGLGQNDSADFVNGTSTAEETVKTRNERVMKPAEVYGGFAFFTTYEPINSPCGGGRSRFYAVDYRSGGLQSGLFINLTNSSGGAINNVRSVELQSGGIPSQPMIMEGASGAGTAMASGVTSSSQGGVEKVDLDPRAFTTGLDILLWREKR